MQKLWIFPSSKPLTGQTGQEIEQNIQDFLESWAAHGKKLKVDYKIAHNHFIIIKVDEEMVQASGCSIDSLTRFMQQLDQKYALDLFNRQKVAVLKNEEVQYFMLNQLQQLLNEGVITAETEVFNNLIQTPSELETAWQQPLKHSAYANFAGIKS